MQAHRIESTMIRLQGVKDNLKEAEEILLEKIAELCKAVPQYTPKGASHSRRMLRNPPLFRKLVAAQALNDADDGDDTEEDSPIAQALRNMSVKDAKVEFERYDQRVISWSLPFRDSMLTSIAPLQATGHPEALCPRRQIHGHASTSH
jgi:hypothetical protein